MAGGGAAAARAAPGARGGVRIVVAGDRGTGKSSLIVTAAADTFPINVPPLLPPTRLPDDLYPDRVPVTIIDTSSRSLSPSPSLSIYLYTNISLYVCLALFVRLFSLLQSPFCLSKPGASELRCAYLGHIMSVR